MVVSHIPMLEIESLTHSYQTYACDNISNSAHSRGEDLGIIDDEVSEEHRLEYISLIVSPLEVAWICKQS